MWEGTGQELVWWIPGEIKWEWLNILGKNNQIIKNCMIK